GQACAPTQECVSGQCVCQAGETLCAGFGCVHTQSDMENCGNCGVLCDIGHVCNAGSCECPAGLTDCSGTCSDIASDRNNCGACGIFCSGFCTGGACMQ